jgi:hypothetical protein
MNLSTTIVSSHPSLEKRGEGRFYQHNFKIPLYSPFPKGIKIPEAERLPLVTECP